MSGNVITTICACLFALAPSQSRAADEWNQIQTEYDAEMHRWAQAMEKIHSKGSGMIITDVSTMPQHPAEKFRPRVRSFAERHLGKPAALPALSWMLSESTGMQMPMGAPSPDASWALEQIASGYTDSVDIMEILNINPMTVMAVGEKPIIDLLELIAKNNNAAENEGRARLKIAEVLFEGSPLSMMMGIGIAPDRSEKKARAISMLRTLVKEFSGQELGKQADALLFAFEYLQVGNELPPVKGKGSDGKTIDLADFRGKVVAIVFWATWCAPCMEMIPHERELLERMKDKPFALVGINVDEDAGAVEHAMQKEKITWPTILDGPPETPGSIATKWRINHFPAIFVVDHKGVIAQRDVPPPMLADAVAGLVAKAGG